MCAIRVGLIVCLVVVACGDNKPLETDATGGPPCSDGIDNDGDGTTDFPDDLGCADAQDDTEDSPPLPACADNRDNDSDGKIDFPNDPGCVVPQADDEADDCPSGPNCPQCSDGQDNDNNGRTDFPDDGAGCASAADVIEFTDDPNACGQGMLIKPLPVSGLDMGQLTGTTSNVSSPCGGGNNLPAVAYVFHLSSPKVIVASTDDPDTLIDTILDLRSSMCAVAGAELACNDDIQPGASGNKKSRITKSLAAGTYYLIVGGKTMFDTGMYKLEVEQFPGEGAPCTMTSGCGPGLECRIPVGQTTLQCAGPVCNDGADDDGDGKIDYPVDPGCAMPTDSTENDVCATMPTSPQCPACSNGLDDDLDGMADYPADPSCTAASTINEACAQSEPIVIATTPQTMGTTLGAANDFFPPQGNFNSHACTIPGTHTAPDVAVQLDLPPMTSLTLRLDPVGYDSTHVLLPASCVGTPIECHDNPQNLIVNNLAAGRYFLIVDGYNGGSGTFTLNVSGTIQNGQSCESPLAQSGAITCGIGYACQGTAGSRTCTPTECLDLTDNNGDGRIDFPNDPGCQSFNDTDENTVCPGASCPDCSDGVDNDGDGRTDYPMDTDCLTAAAPNERCRELDPVDAITSPTTTGTLVGASDDHNPSCTSTNLPDRVYTLTLPTNVQSLVIDTEGSVVDTVLSLMTQSCMEPSIVCDDEGGFGVGDSLIARGMTNAGIYTIAVDSNSPTLGTFELHVRGTVGPGGSCEGALFQSGVLVCPPNFGCNGTPGSRTCTAAQCLDGVDNNTDGRTDFPNDPGCDSTSDNTETTVCPGSSCPVCSDGADNDGDGRTDYPNDPRCQAASGTNEGCIDSDLITSILMPQTTGTLVGKTDDRQPFCTTLFGTDVIYTLTVPALESLTIDTEGSVVDTVLSFMTSDCLEPALECDDDDGTGNTSLISRGITQPGTYTIAIDADTSVPNAYVLNVQGVIAPGASCESPLVATGVLRCSLGFACDGPVGMRTCSVAQCIDGTDNNGDGRTDFPNDPSCTSFSDDSEITVCPGPSCPICSDGIDNDSDGATDYPMDASCFSASAMNEACTQSEAIGAITSRITSGNTANAVNDSTPTCGGNPHASPDLIYELQLPALDTLNFSMNGFDSTNMLLGASCGGTPLQCSDLEQWTRSNVPAGTYYFVVDGYNFGSGPFTLITTGIVAPNGSCEGSLFQSGAFTCATGHHCAGTAGSRTCAPTQCNDAMDNDGDGKLDYPADPGCGYLGDNVETDDCSPTVGPSCPACANGIDDDTDSMTDYPADTRCASASFFRESFCAVEANIAGMVVAPTHTNTLATAANNFSQVCQASTGNDITYGLRLPVPVATLQIDTLGSVAVDTIVSFWDAQCSTSLGCDDDGDPAGNRSVLLMSNVAAGDYAIQVDSYSTFNNLGVTLNVKGTVAAGTACTSDLFAAGVLECPAATICSAGVCQ